VSSAYLPVELRQQVRADAGTRCGYCRTSEMLTGSPLEFDHLMPQAAGGLTARENLWLACHRCNEFKGDRDHGLDPESGNRLPLFNPRTQRWRDHFRWSPDGLLVVGSTPTGRATVEALRLNNEYVMEARRFWVEAGWHPPIE